MSFLEQPGFSDDVRSVLTDLLGLPPAFMDYTVQYNALNGLPIPISQITGYAQSLPSGLILPFGGSSAPSGYLICDGSAISRTTYVSLFDVIGTTWGVGDGSTTFNLPPKGIVLVNYDAAQTEFNTLGKTGGAKTHTLTTAEMPSHSHGGATGNDSPDHTHSAPIAPDITGTFSSGGGSGWNGGLSSTASGGASARHTHSITAEGGGGAHNNLQPYGVVNYIIKT